MSELKPGDVVTLKGSSGYPRMTVEQYADTPIVSLVWTDAHGTAHRMTVPAAAVEASEDPKHQQLAAMQVGGLTGGR